MAWGHQATHHYLNKYSLTSTLPYGLIRPQWVNTHSPEKSHGILLVTLNDVIWSYKMQEFINRQRTSIKILSTILLMLCLLLYKFPCAKVMMFRFSNLLWIFMSFILLIIFVWFAKLCNVLFPCHCFYSFYSCQTIALPQGFVWIKCILSYLYGVSAHLISFFI